MNAWCDADPIQIEATPSSLEKSLSKLGVMASTGGCGGSSAKASTALATHQQRRPLFEGIALCCLAQPTCSQHAGNHHMLPAGLQRMRTQTGVRRLHVLIEAGSIWRMVKHGLRCHLASNKATTRRRLVQRRTDAGRLCRTSMLSSRVVSPLRSHERTAWRFSDSPGEGLTRSSTHSGLGTLCSTIQVLQSAKAGLAWQEQFAVYVCQEASVQPKNIDWQYD